MAENRKRRSRSRSWKRKLERKAGESALLFIMLNKPGFRYTVLAIVFAFLCAGFYMAPIWNIAPEGYEPKVKSSLYQIREASRLKEDAAAAIEDKDWGEAAYLLRVALMKDSVDPTLYRMVVTNSMSQASLKPSDIRDVTLRTEKLLALTQNDSSDLDLVISFLDQQGLNEHAIYTLLTNENLAPNQVKRLLELLFESGKYASFLQVKDQYSGQLQSAFPGLNAYELTISALNKDSFEQAADDIASIKSIASDSSSKGVLARNLLLRLYRHFERSKDYEEAFKIVKKNKEDQPVQHSTYWRILMNARQPQKAVYEAAQYWPFLVHHRFQRLDKAIQIAHAYQEVGLTEKAFEFMDQIQTRFEDEAGYWMGYGDLLLKSENWLEATALAVKLRSQRSGIKLVKPYAYYLEGISQGKLNRRSSASNAFLKLIELSPLKDESTVLNMAGGMLDVGQGSEAMGFLQLHDASLEDRLIYSRLLYRAAKQAGNSLALAEADQALLELRPNLPDTSMRGLETAILTLGDTEAALDSFVKNNPESSWDDTHRLLVACAYMQQENHQEAGQRLDAIDKSTLGLRESAMFAFARFEWLVRAGQIEEAKKQLTLVNQPDLFPSELARLEALELQINTPDSLMLDQ
ncbi:MAG: hypothetical protein HOH33_18030 [Verrucomicrobia bacterium]|jgi:hypothetical protein|nr:hypothetical protein [Verrucomicrobiota bacterium]